MVFSSNVFLFLFLPIFLGLYYLSGQRYRNLLLLIASYIFYAWWRVDFLALFAGVTLWNYWIGLKVGAAGVRTKPAQRWLLLGVVVDLCILGYFKYANFGVDSINAMMTSVGLEPFILTHILLPIGISFYIFESISYIIDVYRGDTPATRNLIDFAAFDIHILQRKGAAKSFPEAVASEAAKRFAVMDDAAKDKLAGNVVFGLPGAAERFTLDDVRAHLAEYDTISEAQLQRHLIDFLAEVAPLAQELGVRLCCHPDDPPFPLLGLPRIMSTQAQYQTILSAVDLPANGVTLCTGSLGARPDNNPVEIMKALGDRVHFLHLRNVAIEGNEVMNSLYEDEHLSGHTDMVAMVAEVVAQEARRKAAGRADWSIPMRPDHGQDILDDIGRAAQPGYPAIGRLKGLAELRGLYRAFEHPISAR